VGPLDRVTTPPYDTIGPDDRRRFLAADPHNVIRIDLGEDRAADDGPDEKYRRAASLLRSWRTEGVLVATPRPSYYPYEMRFAYHGAERTIRGLVCAVELEDWGGSILPHERTMPGPVEDRFRSMRATRSNLSAIESVFAEPSEPIADLLHQAMRTRPAAELTDEQGVDHRLWVAPADDGAVARSVADTPFMIADGHHRYTTALRYRDEMRRTHGAGPWDSVMMLIVDAVSQDLPVLPFHRIVRGEHVARAGVRVRDLEEVLSEVDDTKLRYGLALRDADGAIEHRVAELAGDPPTVCALHEDVLAGRDDDLSFTPDAVEAELAVRTGDAVAAFLLPATTALRIRDVAERGGQLPQKSTYFYPKPRTGLVLRPLE
jgi:uncharacterized protein (DUF1015 family)